MQLSLTSFQARPLRYRLGELLVAEWFPLLAIGSVGGVSAGCGDAVRRALPDKIPRSAHGVLIRDVPAEDFPIGLRRWQREWIEYVPRHDVLYLVDLEGTFPDYLARSLSAKARQNLGRSARKLSALNGDSRAWELFTQVDEMPIFLREASLLSARTYQTRILNVGLEDTPETLAYLQEEAREGRARGYLLKLNSQTIAFAWCRAAGSKLVYETIGYDIEKSSLSPGNVLLYFILEDLFLNGSYQCLDFGPGEAAYKAMFSTRQAHFVDAYFFRRTLPNAVRIRAHQWLYKSSVGLSHLLDRWGIKKHAKSMLRRLHGIGSNA